MDVGHHILVIEDDAETRRAMTLVLELEGYKVVGMPDGRQALDHLRSDGRPCVILLDLMMPVLDGMEFRREQQRDPAIASIPVVVVSADGSVRQKAASLGAQDYLQKPIEVSRLVDLVRRHC